MSKKTCPVCGLPMTEYVDGWRCMNIKAREHNARQSGRPGKRDKFKGKKKR